MKMNGEIFKNRGPSYLVSKSTFDVNIIKKTTAKETCINLL